MSGLDPIIHQATRLQLMAVLFALGEGDWIDFTGLKKELALTDGNLGAQLQKLEEAKYIKVKKSFAGKKPKTALQATRRGRAAFESHRQTLLALLGEE